MFKESDLYIYVKKLFMDKGYSVKSEILDCDVVAIKNDELVIVEMKKNFSIDLLYQIIDRTKYTPMVYAAIPAEYKKNRKKFSRMKKLIKKLGVGLITVSLKSKKAEIISEPPFEITNNRFRNKLLKEFNGRTFDSNLGGITGKIIITAYREQAVKIAYILLQKGKMSAKELRKKYNCCDYTYSILYRNVYNWFEREEKGIYCLNKKGEKEILSEPFSEIINLYIKEMNGENEKI